MYIVIRYTYTLQKSSLQLWINIPIIHTFICFVCMRTFKFYSLKFHSYNTVLSASHYFIHSIIRTYLSFSWKSVPFYKPLPICPTPQQPFFYSLFLWVCLFEFHIQMLYNIRLSLPISLSINTLKVHVFCCKQQDLLLSHGWIVLHCIISLSVHPLTGNYVVYISWLL